jgi:TolA-binding protein
VKTESSSMRKLGLIIAALFLVVGAAVSPADMMTDLKKTSVDLNAQAQTNDGRTRVLTAISNETGVQVGTLQTQLSTNRLGYGDLLIANLLASASNKSFDDIAAMFKAGEGWGKIAKDLGLNLGMIVSKAKRAHRAALHAENAQINQGAIRNQAGSENSLGRGPANPPMAPQGMGHGGRP